MSDQLRIALVGPFEEPIPPPQYGGIERIVGELAASLSFDHNVKLFAAGGSKTAEHFQVLHCTTNPIRSLPEAEDPMKRQALSRRALAVATRFIINHAGEFDVVLNHFYPASWTNWEFAKYQDAKTLPPIISTLHGIVTDKTAEAYKNHADATLIAVSRDQRNVAESKGMHIATVIHNGIDPHRFHFRPNANSAELSGLLQRPLPEHYVAFLGVMNQAKGAKTAISIAKQVGWPLVMAGKVDPLERQYYENEIKPLIDGERIISLGEVDDTVKEALLGGATALISPVGYREPSGIAYLEAMAVGTPVSAFLHGAVPEIVVDRETGVVCETEQEMVQRFDELLRIDRQACRRRITRYFHSSRMADNYTKVIRDILAIRQLGDR